MNGVAIRIEGLGKRYRMGGVGRAPYRTLRDEIMAWPGRLRRALGARAAERDFWALREVSFEVRQGEVLGVIGRNGAGKSTLLKILSRVIDPTEGEAHIRGRVGALLEVGTGFHPELTGRENVFLSGALLGMRRREIVSRLDSIVQFAGVERFVDQPVKNYSSGMYSRLAFAVAAHLESEIVLVDEVLAVGDAEFKQRCGAKMRDIAAQGGRAVVIVSHEPTLIRSLCSRVVVMQEGRNVFSGSPDQAFTFYNRNTPEAEGTILEAARNVPDWLRLESITVGGQSGRRLVLAADGAHLDLCVVGRLEAPARIELEARLCDRDGATFAFFSPGHLGGSTAVRPAGPFRLAWRMRFPRLLQGIYSLRIGLTDPNFSGWLDIPEAVRIDAEGAVSGIGILQGGTHCGFMLLDGDNLSDEKAVGRFDA